MYMFYMRACELVSVPAYVYGLFKCVRVSLCHCALFVFMHIYVRNYETMSYYELVRMCKYV